MRTGLLFGAAVMGIALAAEGGDIPLDAVAGIIGSSGVWGAVMGAIGAGGTPATTVVFEAPDADAPPTPRGPGGPSPRPAPVIETPDADPLPADAAQSRVALPRPTPADDVRGARSRGCCGDVDDATDVESTCSLGDPGPWAGRWAGSARLEMPSGLGPRLNGVQDRVAVMRVWIEAERRRRLAASRRRHERYLDRRRRETEEEERRLAEWGRRIDAGKRVMGWPERLILAAAFTYLWLSSFMAWWRG